MALTQQYKQVLHAARTRMLKELKYAVTDEDTATAERLGKIIRLITREEAIYNENQKASKTMQKRM